MALIITIKKNDELLTSLAAVNVTESEFGRPYGKGMQDYEVYKDGISQGIYIKHEFEKGYEALAAKVVSAFATHLTIPR